MAAQDALDQSLLRWNHEVELEKRLDERRKLYFAAVFAAAGLGVFSVSSRVDPKLVDVIHNPLWQGMADFAILVSGLLLVSGVWHLLSGPKNPALRTERILQELELSKTEVRKMLRSGKADMGSVGVRVARLRLATLRQSLANRKASENLARAAVSIASAYLLLGVRAAIHILA